MVQSSVCPTSPSTGRWRKISQGSQKDWNPSLFPGRSRFVCIALLVRPIWVLLSSECCHQQPWLAGSSGSCTLSWSVSSSWRGWQTPRAGRDAAEPSSTSTAACRTHKNGVRGLTSLSSPEKTAERKENYKEERQAEELRLVVWVSTQPQRNHSAFLLTMTPCVELWSWNTGDVKLHAGRYRRQSWHCRVCVWSLLKKCMRQK